ALRAPAHPAEVLGVPELLRDLVPRPPVAAAAHPWLCLHRARGLEARGSRAGAEAPAQGLADPDLRAKVRKSRAVSLRRDRLGRPAPAVGELTAPRGPASRLPGPRSTRHARWNGPRPGPPRRQRR